MSVLSTAARKEYHAELADALPTPVLNQLEHRDRRRITAAEAFDALRPGDAYEGRLAVRIVLCGAHAVESLREAGVYRDDYAKTTRCRAQAASMMRAESSAKRALEREQKVRLAGEAVAGSARVQPAAAAAVPAHPAAAAAGVPARPVAAAGVPAQPAGAAAAVPAQPAAAGAGVPAQPAAVAGPPQQAEAHPSPPVLLAAAAPAPAAPDAAPEAPAVAPPRLAAAHPAPPPVPAGSGSAPPPSPEAIAMAEALVHVDIVAAARIRRDRGVTPQSRARFPDVALPTDPAVIDALVRGSSAVLSMLDAVGGRMLDAAD
jgi:hypothetical protein